MPNSRTKGAVGERECAAAFEAATGIATHRSAQRTGKHGDADLSCAVPLHLECKRKARIAALRNLRQAEADAIDGRVPVAIMREDRDTEWAVMLRLRDVVQFAETVVAARARKVL